jgi:ribosomal protein S18 acetylase RimI-like enzyme
VVAGSRRARHARGLVRVYRRAGASAGYRRFRLDVWAENRPAVELYRGFGFDVRRRSANHPAGMTHLSMALELDPVSGQARRRRG